MSDFFILKDFLSTFNAVHILLLSDAQDVEERKKVLNYRNENATPRDRYEGYSHRNNMNTTHTDGNSVCYTKPKDGPVCTRYQRNVNYQSTCGADNGFLKKEAPLAMVYSPKQVWKELYESVYGEELSY